ncbi:MAG: hypothetical protein GY870_00640, partial [archaeon]|nr:hypothetical protein [archaeon]
MNYYNLPKRRTLLVPFMIILINFSLLIPMVSALQSFPNSFSEVTDISYDFKQIFTSHEFQGEESEKGFITVDIEKTSDNRLNFSLFYDLNVWMGSGSCYGNEATAMD